jgi:hypothetical protein
MAVSDYQRVEIISSDSLRAVMEMANSLDSSIKKGDYFVDESNRLIGAFQYYRRADDTIQIIYFKFDHLKDYYEQERSVLNLSDYIE